MNVSMYQAAAAMNATSRWQEHIAENLSASSTPGFKKTEVSFDSMIGGRMLEADGVGRRSKFAMPTIQSATNFQAGQLRHTGNPLDLAIEGNGFFEVQLPNGDTAFTRDGEFSLNAQGQLVSKSGHPVMTNIGELQLDPANPAPISVSVDGQISQGDALVGQLRVVEVGDPKLLSPVGGGLFLARDPNLNPVDSVNPIVRQGYLEGANTTPVQEMADLITAMRLFEANQRMIQMHDERMGRAINELGNPR